MDAMVRAVPGGTEIRLERPLNHPPDAVWATLTQPAKLAQWLAQAEMDLRPGGTVVLRWLNTDLEGNHAVAHGTITAFDPPRLIEYETDIHGLLRWEVQASRDGSLLRLTVLRPEGDRWLAMMAAGWQIHLDHLADALGGKPVDWPNWNADHLATWQRYHDRYAATLKRK